MIADLKDSRTGREFSLLDLVPTLGMLGSVDLHRTIQRRERTVSGRWRGLTSAVKFGSIIMSFCTAEKRSKTMHLLSDEEVTLERL